jgi:hypothetical protein
MSFFTVSSKDNEGSNHYRKKNHNMLAYVMSLSAMLHAFISLCKTKESIYVVFVTDKLKA